MAKFAYVVCGLIVCLSTTTLADDKQQVQLKQLKRSISNLENKLETQSMEKHSLQAELKRIELKASKINRSIRQLRSKTNGLERELVESNRNKQRLQQSISEQNARIAEEIRTAHKLGLEEPVKLLLNQENPQKLARTIKYYEYFLQARREKIQRYTRDVDALSALGKTIGRQKLKLAQTKSALEADRQRLARQVSYRKKTLNKVQTTLRTDKRQLDYLRSQRNQLQEVISAVTQASANMTSPANYPPFVSHKGKLSWPLKGSVAHSFGSKRSGSLRWEGWLINSQAGAAVSAVHHGRVVFANYLRGFGLLVIVDHGDNYMTLYAHNQALLKNTGDWVQSNEVLARSGNTGGLSKPALYFEIRNQGKPADPKLWLGKR